MAGLKISGRLRRRLRFVKNLMLRRPTLEKAGASTVQSSGRQKPVETLAQVETPRNAGYIFDAELLSLEAAAIAHQPTEKWGDIYQVVKTEFDPIFYVSFNKDIREKRLDPVGHYLRAGAKENRDPTPWFSTAEYRRKYMVLPNGQLNHKINPFYHYLTEGRAAGHAPRAPANYDIFCNSIGLDPATVSDLVKNRADDVVNRLRHGELGEMVKKANALDPLVGQAWRAALRVRVPPASNAIGVRRIGHFLDLQRQAGGQRARAVVVIESSDMAGSDAVIRDTLAQVVADAGATQTVVIVTGGVAPAVTLDAAVRVVYFDVAQPKAKDYKPCRTLFEFIRSMTPETVVNLNARLMNKAMRVQGRALAASSLVYQYVPFDGFPEDEAGVARLGSRFYRAIDQGHRVIVQTAVQRDHLAELFMLPDAAFGSVWVAELGGNQPPFVAPDIKREAARA